MLGVSGMQPHAEGNAGVECSSLQVTALALPICTLLFLHINKAPKPRPHLGGSFSFFFPVFAVLGRKEKEIENVFALCISAVACPCGSEASF